MLYVLFIAMVVIGLVNSTPGIPGYDDLMASLVGQDGMKFRKVPSEWFYPVFFAPILTILGLLLTSKDAVGLGLSLFTAHMFIFYFAVASAITPPVALAAFAAATITKAEPMATAFSAVKSGIVIFVVPFVFAYYPELLLIPEAVLDPQSPGGNAYLPGYDGQIYLAGFSC